MRHVGPCFALLFMSFLLEPVTAHGSHTTFEFKVDRVEVIIGGGAPQVDEFGDGDIAPWILNRGTAFESNGFLVLKNPGVHSFLPGYGLTVDVSDVVRGYPGLALEADISLDSRWAPILPAPLGERFSMTASYSSGSGSTTEFVALVLQNLGNAEAVRAGLPSGLSMVQLLGNLVSDPLHPGELLSIDFPIVESVAVSPLDVTGDILLHIDWDAATRLFTTSFSLDGGTSFQTPFPTATLPAATLASGPVFIGLIADPVALDSAIPTLGMPGRGALLFILALLAFASLATRFPALTRAPRRTS